MKLNIRKEIWIFALAVVVTAFVMPAVAAAQSDQDQSRDQANRNDNANNLMYQQGLNHGQADRANNQAHQYRLQPNNADDRRAYESGYDQGYQNSRDANPDYREQNGHSGARSESNDNVASRNGFQDGANDGLEDRQGGHSSRATQRHNYKDGDRGYSSSFWTSVRRTSADRATKDQYKASYRQAYIQGYEKGYNSQQGSDNR
jgi:hypothetical protein